MLHRAPNIREYSAIPQFAHISAACVPQVTTPFIRRYVKALPEFRDIDVLGIVKEEGLTRLQKWIQVCFLPNLLA